MMAVGALALAAGNVQATPLSALLGLNKPEIDLTDAEVDTLSKYQVEHFAMGYGAPVTVYTSSAKSRLWLKAFNHEVQARSGRERIELGIY